MGNKNSEVKLKKDKVKGQDIPIPEDLKEYYGEEIACMYGYPEYWEKKFERVRQKLKNEKDAIKEE
jgi:hypothetical protein